MRLTALLLLFSTTLSAAQPVTALYHSLDHSSFTQLLTFYRLHPDTTEGREALDKAWTLVGGDIKTAHIPEGTLNALLSLTRHGGEGQQLSLTAEQVSAIRDLATHLPNRRLAGYDAQSLDDLKQLSSDQIDLGRALLLAQGGGDWSNSDADAYEALLDLLALQVRVRLPDGASPLDKVTALNRLIFDELGFRFPPHEEAYRDIDTYSHLASILDSRRGVCLGVSLLYLCLAQRVDLPLNIVTPPGHIYLSCSYDGAHRNIETTARGIDVPDEAYLGIQLTSLPQRTMRDAVGMIFYNQASVQWQSGDYAAAADSYSKAAEFMEDDPLPLRLLGFQQLFLGNIEHGRTLLEQASELPEPHLIATDTTATDYLAGHCDIEALKTLFTPCDETREALLARRETLRKIVEQYPLFRAAHLQLAFTELRLHGVARAMERLEQCAEIDRDNCQVHYYLAGLALQRGNYPQAWKHWEVLEAILKAHHHKPKAVANLGRALLVASPRIRIQPATNQAT